MFEYVFAFGSWLILLIVSLLIRKNEKSWLAPSALFSIVWCFIIGLSLLLAPEYYFSPIAIIFITCCIVSFFIGGLLVEKNNKKLNINADNKKYEANITSIGGFRIFMLTAIVAGILSNYFLVDSYGFSFTSLLSYSRYHEFADLVTNDRYLEGISIPQFSILLLSIAYTACIVGGAFVQINKKWYDNIWILLVHIPILVLTVLSTSRAIFLYGLFLSVGAFLANNYFVHQHQIKLFTPFRIAIFGVSAICIVLVFVFTQASRMNADITDTSSLAGVLDHLKVWFAGNVSGFSYWIDYKDWLSISPKFGAYTFGGVFEKLGIMQRNDGVFQDYFDASGDSAFTNIYTLFRFLIEDFTAAGSLIFLFLLGALAKYVSIQLLKFKYAGVTLLGSIYSLLLFSFIASILVYNSILFAIILSWVYFIISPPQIVKHEKA